MWLNLWLDVIRTSSISHFVATRRPRYKKAAEEADDLLGTLLHHKENDDFPPMPTLSITKRSLALICKTLPLNTCLALRSKAQFNKQDNLFFPLLDLSCPSRNNDAVTIKSLKHLILEIHRMHGYNGSGFLLRTTNSYHYYGSCPLEKEEWLSLLGRFLLLHPKNQDFKAAIELGFSTIIDARFVGHALLAGQGSLRISPDARAGFPKVVAEINPRESDGSPD
jgi:hypothetical protein